MKTRLLLGVAALALLAVAVQGQDAPAEKPPYEWKFEGETADVFKATIVVNQKVDLSTPRGVVEAYSGFTDGRDITRKADSVVRAAWQAALNKSLAGWEEKLLSKEAREALAKARDEDSRDTGSDRTSTPTEIKAETKVDDNTVQVETYQKTINRAPGKDGQVNESVWENKLRYTCSKGEDGKWRIGKMERHQRDWSSEEEKFVWKEDIGMLSFLYFTLAAKPPAEAVEPKQDTAENAALSLYTGLIARSEALQGRLGTAAFPSFRDNLEPLFTKGFIDAAKIEAEVEGKRPEGEKPAAAEVESVTDGENGTKVVKLKKFSDWSAPVQVTVKQVDGKWLVMEAGVIENVGGIDRGPQYRAIGNIYNLPKPR